MESLIDKIAEQVYAQFNEDVDSPEQKSEPSPEPESKKKDDITPMLKRVAGSLISALKKGMKIEQILQNASKENKEIIVNTLKKAGDLANNPNLTDEEKKVLGTIASKFDLGGGVGDATPKGPFVAMKLFKDRIAKPLKNKYPKLDINEFKKFSEAFFKAFKIGLGKGLFEILIDTKLSDIILLAENYNLGIDGGAYKRFCIDFVETLKDPAVKKQIGDIQVKASAEDVKDEKEQGKEEPGEKEADPEEEKGEEEQGEMEDPELWDPSPEIKDAFMNAYNQFRQRFYRVRKLLDQGKLVAALKKALEEMSEDEEGEAAIERYSDEDTPPTEEKPTANESQRPGQISEGFLKWLMISRATDLVLESMNEADADVVDKVMKDRDAARKKVGMDDAPEEGEDIPKKDLQNIQADVESFYQNALKMRDGLDKIADAAKAGKADFSIFKKQWMKQASEIQDDIVELYNDLINLSPPKKKLDEQEEGEEQKEISDMDRVEKAKMLQKVYDRITDQLAPIAKALDSKKDLPYYRMAEPVEQSLKSLNTVLQIFPSVQAFKGGTADDMIKGYDSMMSDLDILTKLFQRLIKSGEMSSLTIRNLYKGLMKFSKGLEDLFNVKSKIEDKPAPEAAEKPADAEDKPEDEEASDEKDTDGDEFPDEEEEQAGTDPEDPEDVPADADDDGASDAAEEEAGTDPEDPQSKPDEDKEFNINSPQAAETHIKKVMPYSDFQRIFSNSDVTVDQYNALMLLYLLSKYEAPKQEQEKKGFSKDPLSVATRKSEAFFGFSKAKVNDNLIRLRTLNKPAFNSLLSFFKTAKPAEMRKLAALMNKRMKLKPFTVSAAPNKLVSDSTAPQFADSADIKKANAEEPPKPKKQKPKNPMLDLAPDRKELSKIYRERLMKKLKPIVENLLRGMNG